MLWNVQSISVRQSVIPDSLLGRASASIRLVVWGSIPLGSVAGGAIGGRFGSSVVFFGSGAIQVGLLVWGRFSSVMRSASRDVPTVEEVAASS